MTEKTATGDGPAIDKVVPGTDETSLGGTVEGLEPDEIEEGAADTGGEAEGDDDNDLIGSLDDDDVPAEGTDDKAPQLSKAVPKTAADYALPKVEGMEWSDASKTHWGNLTAKLHSVGAPQGAVDAIGSALSGLLADQTARDEAMAKDNIATLTAELGADEFARERGRIKNALKAMPGKLGDAMLKARLPDGSRLSNSPDFFRWMQNQNARTRVPTTTDRLKEIQAIMKRDVNEYYSLGLSDEYAELLARQEGER